MRSLSGLGSVGCESTAAIHFSPSLCPIARLWGCKSGKNCPRWGRFSLSTPQARQAPRVIDHHGLAPILLQALGQRTGPDIGVRTRLQQRDRLKHSERRTDGRWPMADCRLPVAAQTAARGTAIWKRTPERCAPPTSCAAAFRWRCRTARRQHFGRMTHRQQPANHAAHRQADEVHRSERAMLDQRRSVVCQQLDAVGVGRGF